MKAYIGKDYVDLSKICMIEEVSDGFDLYFSGDMDSCVHCEISKENIMNLLQHAGLTILEDIENNLWIIKENISAIECLSDEERVVSGDVCIFFTNGSSIEGKFKETLSEVSNLFPADIEIPNIPKTIPVVVREGSEKPRKEFDRFGIRDNTHSFIIKAIVALVVLVIGGFFLSSLS